MNARIVLFLGRRQEAKKTRYVRIGQSEVPPEKKTYLPWPVLMKDVAEACPGRGTQVVVIGSNETYEDWKRPIDDDACDAEYQDRERLPIAFLCYQDDTFTPSDPTVYWGFFNNLRRVLGGEPVAGLEGFRVIEDSPVEAFAEPADYVLMDITRGFRAVPFIGASALAFVRAADRRRQDRPSVRHRIFYAAYETKSDDDITPVWDLTPFVDGVELSDALNAFACHGRADDLARFFQESQNQAANAIAEPMKQFADDLLLMRIPNLLTSSAKALHNALASRLRDLKDAYPPLSEDLDGFAEQVDRLVPQGANTKPISEEGMQAAAVLAERLWETGRYAELYNLLRESLLTTFSVVAVFGDKEQPGNLRFDKHREKVEGKCRTLRAEGKPKQAAAVTFIDPLPPIAQRIADQLGEVADHRNDVAHCSMRSEPRTQEELRNALRSSLDAFRELVASLKAPPGGS